MPPRNALVVAPSATLDERQVQVRRPSIRPVWLID
jgi:hypothetical protein